MGGAKWVPRIRVGVSAYFSRKSRRVRTAISLSQQARPTTRAELLDVPGIGPHKLEQFGEELLKAFAGWKQSHPALEGITDMSK